MIDIRYFRALQPAAGRSNVSGRTWPLILVLGGTLLIVMLVLTTTTSAQTPPPVNGDWVVTDSTTISDTTITLNGSLSVTSQGVLVLNDVDLAIRGAAPGSVGIYVHSNSKLDFNGGTIGSGDTYAFEFSISRNGILEMDDVYVTDMWQNGEVSTEDLRGGLQIASDNVVLTNCTLSGNDRVAITVVDAAPLIQDCVLARSAYYTFSKVETLIQRDAYGILNIRGSPRVERCVIREMGDYNTTYNDYVFYWSGCYLRVFAYAIYSIEGGMVVTDSNVTETGRLDNTYSVNLIEPGTGRLVYIHQYYQLYRATVWAVEPDSLTIEDCYFTRNYLGIWESSNRARGIHVQGGTAEVIECQFIGNGGSAISAEYANLTVSGCEAVDNLFTSLALSGKGHYSVSDLVINGTGGTRQWDTEQGVSLVDLSGNATLNNMTVTNVQFAFMLTRCTDIEIWDSEVLDVTKSFFMDGAQVDFLNVSFDRTKYDLRLGHSDVRILSFLSIEVTWPDGRPVPDAEVRMFNEEGQLVFDNLVGPEGDLGPFAFPEIRIEGSSAEVNLTDNTRLSAYAVIGLSRSEVLTFNYVWHTDVLLVVRDDDPPHLEIIHPLEGHIQASSTITVRGIAWDLGSGVDHVEVRVDEEGWSRADGADPWSITLGIEDGVHVILVRAIDMSGGSTVVSIDNVTVDSTPPFIDIEKPSAGERRTNVTSIVVRGLTESGARVFINAKEVQAASGEFLANHLLAHEGMNIIVVTAIDPAGNTFTFDLQVTLDTTPPWLDILQPLNKSLVAAPFTTLEGRTEDSAEVSVNGDPVQVSNGQFTEVLDLNEGVNQVTVTTRDDLGNERTLTLLVIRDMTPPDIEINFPKGDYRTNGVGFLLTGTLPYMSHDVKWMRLNGWPWRITSEFSGVFQMWRILHEGENRIVFEAEDYAGNIVTRVFNVTLDTQPPVLTVTSPSHGTTVNWSSVYVSGMVEGAVDLLFNNESVVFDPGEFNQLVALTSSGTPAGELNVIEVRAVDDVGNEATMTLEVICDINGPGLTLEPVPEITREELVFINGSVSDVDDVAAIHIDESVIECDADGTFSVLWHLSGPITELHVRAVDHAGNEDVENITIVLDRQTDDKNGGEDEGISTPLILALFAILFVLGALLTMFALRRIDRGRSDT